MPGKLYQNWPVIVKTGPSNNIYGLTGIISNFHHWISIYGGDWNSIYTFFMTRLVSTPTGVTGIISTLFPQLDLTLKLNPDLGAKP